MGTPARLAHGTIAASLLSPTKKGHRQKEPAARLASRALSWCVPCQRL